jgi:hypothetical protein
MTGSAPAGLYFVRVVATNACGSSAPSSGISVVIGGAAPPIGPVPAGTYDGEMVDHANVSAGRPAIRSFILRLNQPIPTGGLQVISATWSDNAGCQHSTNIFGGTSNTGFPAVSIEGPKCNSDGRDLGLSIRAISGNTYEGTCPLGGPNCTFRMTRLP